MSSSSSARISITSDEVNLLVYRYLVEAGFKHTAFVFHGESQLHRSPNLVQSDMPPGSLVTLLQKALLFLYVETHVASDGTQILCDDPFSLFKPHDHDHGPIEAPLRFEDGQVNEALLKRSESVHREGEEGPERPSKKSKGSVKEKRETSSVPLETSSIPSNGFRSILETSESKSEATDFEKSSILNHQSRDDHTQDGRINSSREEKESNDPPNESYVEQP